MSPLNAAVFDNTQNFGGSMGAATTEDQATITAVDTSKTFIFHSAVNGATGWDDSVSRTFLSNSTTHDVERQAGGGTHEWESDIVEFSSGVTIQAATTGSVNTPQNETISAVDLSTTFVVFSMECNESSTAEDECLVENSLTTTTNLLIQKGDVNNAQVDTYYYVIEGDSTDDWEVQFFDVEMETVFVSTDTITSVNTGNSFLIASSTSATSGGKDEYMIRCVISDSTTVTCSRDSNTDDGNRVQGYVVELNDGGTVANYTMTSTDDPIDTTITAVTIADVSTTPSYWGVVSDDSISATAGTSNATREITSTTNLRVHQTSATIVSGSFDIITWNKSAAAAAKKGAVISVV